MKEGEKSLDPQLWHACAGGLVQIPQVNTKVFYFPQGHAEHAQTSIDLSPSSMRVPPLIPCRVASVKFMADPETDEVFAKIKLIPLKSYELDEENDTVLEGEALENQEKPSSFAKTLTQSDANNGGGFSVPRYCAETIFPRLDYSAEPPVQTVVAKDVHGELWKFRHIYRGTPRRHLLTTGWSTFVNQKKLVAGDSVVFLRAENGELCVSQSAFSRHFSPGKDSIAEFSWQLGFDTGHCKVFLESEDVGRTLDLSSLGSYEELYRRLANMFDMERSEMSNHVLYRDATGAIKKTGEEPFNEFMKTAKRLTILTDSSSKNIRRAKITGTLSGEHGLDASNKTGPLGIFA